VGLQRQGAILSLHNCREEGIAKMNKCSYVTPSGHEMEGMSVRSELKIQTHKLIITFM
jgi:hypothetical protein